MWLGFSEFSAPVHFSRAFSNLIANLIRNTIGSIGVSLLMWWFGGVFILMAIERLRPSKRTSPNHHSSGMPDGASCCKTQLETL